MPHTGTVPLETARLRMRRFSPADAEAMFAAWAADAEVTRWMTWAPHQSVEETRRFLASWQAAYRQDDYYHWALTLKDSGALIGSLGILFTSHNPGEEPGFSPGYCLARTHWGQGYATEALAAALAHFVQNTGITALHCCHAVENPASGRVMEKCGFAYHRDGHFTRLDGTRVPAKYYLYQP